MAKKKFFQTLNYPTLKKRNPQPKTIINPKKLTKKKTLRSRKKIVQEIKNLLQQLED